MLWWQKPTYLIIIIIIIIIIISVVIKLGNSSSNHNLTMFNIAHITDFSIFIMDGMAILFLSFISHIRKKWLLLNNSTTVSVNIFILNHNCH
jgi:hypothetical protein